MKERITQWIKSKKETVDESADALTDAELLEKYTITPSTIETTKSLQEQKEARLEKLKQDRLKLHGTYRPTPEDIAERKNKMPVQYNGEKGFFIRIGFEEIPLSRGDILTAHHFGSEISLPRNAPKEIQRELMQTVARDEISSLYDQQLSGIYSESRHVGEEQQLAYESVHERSSMSDEKVPMGILAEKMVLSWLTKLSLDNQISFSIESVDVVEDVSNKIDFIITISDYKRAVEVDETDDHEVGIQFTINTEEETQKKKTEQLKKSQADVDDKVLLTVPMNTVKDVYGRWSKRDGKTLDPNQRDPRGPDHLLHKNMKEQIIKKLLQSLPKKLALPTKQITKTALKPVDPLQSLQLAA